MEWCGGAKGKGLYNEPLDQMVVRKERDFIMSHWIRNDRHVFALQKGEIKLNKWIQSNKSKRRTQQELK